MPRRIPVLSDWSAERRALLVVGLGTLMSSVDTTVTNVGLRTISQSLHAAVGDVQWIVTAYLLAVASVIPMSGWLARRIGPRIMYSAGLALFALSSALCAVAGSLPMLVAGRVLQGAAAGLLVPLSQLITAEVSGAENMARALSRIWMITDVGLVLGPVLGGTIIDGLGWRWIFLINLPIGIVATALAALLLPALPTRPAGPLDLSGALRLSPGVLLLVLALAEAERHGSPLALAATLPLLGGLMLLGDFVRHALHKPNPLLDLRLYRRPTFACGSLAIFFVNLAWFGVVILLPLYFQQVRHLSTIAVGAVLAPQGIGVILGVWQAGRMTDRELMHRVGLAAVVVFIVVAGLFARIGPTGGYAEIFPALLVSGFAAGMFWVPATAAGYIGLSDEELSHASAIMSVMVRLGASFGTALAAIFLQRGLAAHTAGSHQAHLVNAYHSSFAWTILTGGLAALVVFVGLSRARTGACER